MLSLPFCTTNAAGLAGNGATIVVAFYTDAGQLKFVRFDNGALLDATPRLLGTFEQVSRRKPAVAFDGERFLVAWEDGQAIRAAAVERDGSVTPIDVPHLAGESLPSIAVIGANRFLLCYESRRGSEWRVARRFIDVAPFRRRPSR